MSGTIKKTLGGDRLGTEGKMEVEMRKYSRSNHDLSYPFRTTMAPGTLVPFMKQLAMPGDTWDIDLQMEVLTLPTLGPLFGSYKCEADIFSVPIRLYQADLHNNTLGIGLDMSQIKLPLITVKQYRPSVGDPGADELGAYQPIHPSCILHYLGLKGIGQSSVAIQVENERNVNAIPLLAYYDIFKQYYSNKQEPDAFVIHNAGGISMTSVDQFTSDGGGTDFSISLYPTANAAGHVLLTSHMEFSPLVLPYTAVDIEAVKSTLIQIADPGNLGGTITWVKVSDLFYTIQAKDAFVIEAKDLNGIFMSQFPTATDYLMYSYRVAYTPGTQLHKFNIGLIDTMRYTLLNQAGTAGAYIIPNITDPYTLFNTKPISSTQYASAYNSEGLLIKTYLSDLLNNWIKTTTYDNITQNTRVAIVSGAFSIDSLRLANKLNQLLQRVAISGGTYDDWLETVYTADQFGKAEMPIYMGSLIKELDFAQVISTAAVPTESQPLGTLAGRGMLRHGHHKGGKIVIKVSEPSYIMGICHITPRIDYSQGNDFDIDLKTMDDLHKPALDDIGFQELITERLGWFGTEINALNVITQYSVGYQPAWIDYMTNIPQVHGNFAIPNSQMFMTLNRRYQQNPFVVNNPGTGIEDITTYIDPAKFNFIFAETDLSAQNFWMQIGVNAYVRRKMSAKIMPNL
nr:MAG: major capsid protein [Microviridae sp.]